MMKSGLFMMNEEPYQVFEIESKGYYRLDICKIEAQFHIEPDKIIFSMYKRKKTHMYGDREIYKQYVQLKEKLIFANLPSISKSEWDNGRFKLIQLRGGDDKSFFMDKHFSNGKPTDENYVDGVNVISLKIDPDMEFNTLPINSKEYKAVEIDGETTKSNTPYVPLSVLAAKFNLEWIDEREYFVVKTIEQAREVLEECVKSKFLVGFDYETDGLENNLYTRANIVGVVLSPQRNYSYYIPFGMRKFENVPWEFLHEIEEAFQKIHMESAFTDDDNVALPIEAGHRGAVAHNAKFENKVTKAWGLNIPIRHDSFILSYIINPNKFKGTHGLKGLEYERSGLKFLELEDIFQDKSTIDFSVLDEELTRVYACPDADNACGVFEDLWAKLPAHQRAIYELEAQLVEIKSDQEYWGIRISEETFLKNYKVARSAASLLLKIIQAMLRTEANINSTQVLQHFLYDKMKAPVVLRTSKGKPSTSAKALTKLSSIPREEPSNLVKEDIKDDAGNILLKAKDLNNAKYPVVLVLEKYRELNKQITAFYNRIIRDSKGDLKRLVDEDFNGVVEGFQTRYFFWISQYGAESGRQSSPIHQLPKVIKKGVLADSDDHYLADTDYMQVELRLIFSLAGETKLIELCKDPNNDMHRSIACLVQNKEMWEISAEERQRDKARNFGVVYLISGMGLALQKYGAGATKEQIDECTRSIADFYEGAKRVSLYIKKNREKVLRDKQISTLFNRPRYFPELADPDLPRDRKESLIRQANNLPVQGLAADIMKRAEVNMDIYIKQKGWDKLVDTPQGKFPLVRSMLTAHDELLASCHKSIPVEEIMLMKRKCMEIAIEGFAPLFAGTSIIDNWEEGKASKYEVPVDLRNKMINDYLRTGKSALDMTKSPKLEMLRITNEYRENNLREYMEGLIAQHGEDPDVVAQYVRDGALTHELIDRFPQDDEDKKERGSITHLEQIVYSTHKYFEYREQDTFNNPIKGEEIEFVNHIEEGSGEDIFEEIVGLQESLVTFDDEGEIIVEEGEELEDDMDGFYFDDEIEFIKQQTSGERLNVWMTYNVIVLDINELSMENADKVIAKVWENRDPDGFYSVQIHYNGELLKLDFKIETIDINDLQSFITELIKEQGEMAL